MISLDTSLSPGFKLIFCQPSSHTIQSLSPWTEAFPLVFSSYSASLQATQYSHDLPGQKPFPLSLAHILPAFKPHNTVMISLDRSLSPGFKLIFCQPSSHTIQSLSPWTEDFPWSLAHILPAFKPHNTVMISLDRSPSPGL